jgi:large conductance mechanosensitive channel
MLKEFREFAMRGNVLDMAVGIIIGAAFGGIITSMVADVIMPPIGLVMGNVDFTELYIVLKVGEIAGPYTTLTAAQEAGAVTVNYGLFLNTLVNFVIVAFAMFLLIRSVNRLQIDDEAPPSEPTTKDCPHCFTQISTKATRCPNCTTKL